MIVRDSSWISVTMISCMVLAGIVGGDYTVWSAYAQSNTELIQSIATDTDAIRQHLNLGMGEGILYNTNTKRIQGIAADTDAIRQHLNLGMGEGILHDTNTKRIQGIVLDTSLIRQHLGLGVSVIGGTNTDIIRGIAANTDIIRQYYGIDRPVIEPVPDTIPVIEISPANQNDPMLDVLRLHMLNLINSERARAGLNPVILGYNAAAQSHADSMLKNCFASHWGMNGLKPYMRYSAAGGYQSNAENISGLDYCIKPQDGYATIGSTRSNVDDMMSGLMESPGHRANILNPHHHAVNIGLAWDSYNIQLVQHFEYNYVQFIQPPDITNGILTMSGTATNTAGFIHDNDLGVQIYYDQTPHDLTLGQLSRTHCYENGALVTSLRPQLHGNWYYPTDTFTTQGGERCINPYDTSPNAPAPASPDDAYRIWQEAVNTITYSAPATIPWTDAHTMTTHGTSFEVRADISETIQWYGNGVYTIVVWGVSGGEDVVIAEAALFYDATLDDTYTWVENLPDGTFRGKLHSIVDVDTLQIDDNIYKLALIDTPKRGDAKYDGANRVIQSVCMPGDTVHIHIDDGQGYDPIPAQVWCGDTHLQTALLYSGYAEFDHTQCSMTDLEGDWIRCR